MARARETAGFNCRGATAAAIPFVLAPRLKEMFLLRERALDFSDPEGVHDMRVASRRLRSALRDFRPYLRKAKLAPSMQQIKQVADALGVVRDCDVAIIALEKLAMKVTGEISSGIQQLMDDQKAKQAQSRQELIAVLDQQRVGHLESSFAQALEASLIADPDKGKDQSGSTNYTAFAKATILNRFKELDHLSNSLYEPLRTKPLHQMRIAAKRLRYALELFKSCWGEPIDVFAQQVAELQSSLGEVHDCDVWIQHVGSRLGKPKKKSGQRVVQEDESAAMIWLLGHFTKIRTKHFRNALARWYEWQTTDFRNRLTQAMKT